jgi:hypothetical protein
MSIEKDLLFDYYISDFVQKNGSMMTLESQIAYGKSGFKTVVELEADAYDNIGSIHYKFKHSKGNNVSVLLFIKSGKIKISGGLTMVEDCKNKYIQSIVEFVCIFFKQETVCRYSISMINAQVKMVICPKTFRKLLYSLQGSNKFSTIKEPALTGKGRITCAKVYPFSGRRCHLSIDPKGTVQFFAFKSFDELEQCKNLVNSFT